ncbi:MAG: hypothetical protein A4E35_00387 [Methanoregula sp. PtaU1.Bin051]|nr:MAG: hypothetical protein A4E35_00387 [Methanoregula sp. PtaU1.Bin051]
MRQQREQTLRYIRERRCTSGGYCFYRLDEPNAADTFYALDSFRLLGEPVREDPDTIHYLHSFQHDDGSYQNVFVGAAVIRALHLLGERPQADPSEWIGGALSPDQKNRPVESVSGFEEYMLAAECCRVLMIEVPEVLKEQVVSGTLRYRNKDGGFGNESPTLIETFHAVFALAGIGYDMKDLVCPAFLASCEDLVFGFLAVPGARPGFLEHVHAGLSLCVLLGYSPRFPDACEGFIRRCHRENGGYCRSLYGGSATLEHTWRALECHAILRRLEGNN